MESNASQTEGQLLGSDSTLDTLLHSRRVDELMIQLIASMQLRVTKHDLSKMMSPEKDTFDKHTPRLKGSTYGSEEYQGFLKEMKPALDHHYANNRHHPEHFVNGVDGMTLIDLVEMLADWKASGERHEDGSIEASMEIQRVRFNLSDQLYQILINTIQEAGWFDS
jgi:hypothetical protein